MSDWRGCVRWGFVPFTPAAPFRLYVAKDAPLLTEPDATQWAERKRTQGARGDDAFVVMGKLRPVLVLHDPPQERGLAELTALRLIRLETRSEEEQATIRAQGHPGLFYLDRHRRPGLTKEYAASLASLVRLHRSAVVDAPPAARLNENEFRVISERLIQSLGLDITTLVHQRASQLRRRRS